MTSSTPPPHLLNTAGATLLPKPVARALASFVLRLRSPTRALLLFLAALFVLVVLASQIPSQLSAPPHGRTVTHHIRRYSDAEVKDCVHRTPNSLGRTFETRVHGVDVSFASWTKNETFDKDIVKLRTHEAVRIIKQFDRPVTLLDVGANIGKVTFPVLAMPHSHTVIAVEPVKTNMNLLCLTANLNGWLSRPGLMLLEAAMSDRDGTMEIFVPEGREDNAALNSEAATANVHEHKHGEVVRLLVADDVIEDSGLKPDIIKIDTQGHEIHVMRGLRKYLATAKPRTVLVMAESDPKLMQISGVDPKDVYQLMTTELKYSPYCKPLIEVTDGEMHVSGEILTKESYPPGGCRDIYYFKQS